MHFQPPGGHLKSIGFKRLISRYLEQNERCVFRDLGTTHQKIDLALNSLRGAGRARNPRAFTFPGGVPHI